MGVDLPRPRHGQPRPARQASTSSAIAVRRSLSRVVIAGPASVPVWRDARRSRRRGGGPRRWHGAHRPHPGRSRPTAGPPPDGPSPSGGWPVATLPGVAVSRMTDLVGRVLSGRYRLIAPIGSGASAQVFLADDARLRRRVAVKLLHAGLADDDGFLRRFRAEAQAAAALNHPNIVAVYDWGEDEGTPYLVTEYLAGGSLRADARPGHPALAEPGAARRARGDPRPRLRPPPGLRPPRHQARQPPLRRGRAPPRRRLRSRPRPRRGGLDRARRRRPRHRPLRLTGAAPGARRSTAGPTCTPSGSCSSRRSPARSRSPPTPPSPRSWRASTRPSTCRPRSGRSAACSPGRASRRPTTGPTPASSPSASWPRPRSCRAPSRCRSSAPPPPTACRSPTSTRRCSPAPPPTATAVATRAPTASSTSTTATAHDDRRRRRAHRARAGRRQRRRRRRWPRVLLAVVLLAGLAVGGFLAWQALAVPSHPVPELVGMDRGAAIEARRRERLGATRSSRAAPTAASPGQILAQDPSPAVELDEGELVRLTVSLGQQLRPVPTDLVGLPFDQAERPPRRGRLHRRRRRSAPSTRPSRSTP